MNYAALSKLLDGSVKQVQQDIVGKEVTLALSRARGRNIPAGTYVAGTDAAAYFRCKTVRSGFSGGEVTAKVTGYSYLAKSKQKIVELGRCDPAADEAERPPPSAPATRASASAVPSDCAAHFTNEGNLFSGHKYSTWVIAPGVSKADAFSRVIVALTKDGYTIASSDKDAGVISATQGVAFSRGQTVPLTTVVESSGTGAKLTMTFRTAGGLAASESTVQTKMCEYLAAAAGR